MRCLRGRQDNPAGAGFGNGCGAPLETVCEGERKQVTVLFADLKGSAELLADRDPEEARTLLDALA